MQVHVLRNIWTAPNKIFKIGDIDGEIGDVGWSLVGGEIGAQVVLRQVAYSRPPAQYILKSSAPSTLPPPLSPVVPRPTVRIGEK